MPIPEPTGNETQADFIARFMADEAMRTEFPEEKQRVTVAYKKFTNSASDPDDDIIEEIMRSMSKPAGVKNSRGQTGKPVKIRFIEPGVVFYEHLNNGKGGNVLVRKEALDKMNKTAVGKPIFNFTHKSVSHNDFTNGKAQGVLANDSSFNPQDAWFYVTGLVWDDETLENIKKGYSVSCAYDVTEWGPGGTYHNIPYEAEVINGEYTHIAVVDNPRYEDASAQILVNQGGGMQFKFWKKDDKGDLKASEMELVNAKVTVAGKEVALADMVAHFEAQENAKRASELMNSITDDTVLEIVGKKVTVRELKNAFASTLKNESEDKEKEEKKKKDEEARNAAEEKEKKEKEDDMKNSAAHAAGSHKESPLDNCKSCVTDLKNSGLKSFAELANAARTRPGSFKTPDIQTQIDRIKRGSDRYGSVQAA
jgi:hypothetical protein